MSMYDIAVDSGLRVQFDIQAGVFVVTISWSWDDEIYLGRGLTLDAAVIDALAEMDGAAETNRTLVLYR